MVVVGGVYVVGDGDINATLDAAAHRERSCQHRRRGQVRSVTGRSAGHETNMALLVLVPSRVATTLPSPAMFTTPTPTTTPIRDSP